MNKTNASTRRRKLKRWQSDVGRSLIIGLGAALLMVLLGLRGSFDGINRSAFDLMSTFHPPAVPMNSEIPEDAGIVLVTIDEKSFNDLQQQWPWPRQWHAELIDKLRKAGAQTVALDLIFADPGSVPAGDVALAAALGADNVLAGDVSHSEDTDTHSSIGVSTQSVIGVLPLPIFLAHGAGYGIPQLTQDVDGALRSLPTYSTLMVQDGTKLVDGKEQPVMHRVDTFPAAILWHSGIDPQLETVPAGALIQYLPPNVYKKVSYSYVHDNTEKKLAEDFAGKIVLVGLALQSSLDLQHSQADSFITSNTAWTALRTPGVEINATIIDNLRHRLYILPAPSALIYLAGLIAALLAARLLGKLEMSRAAMIAIFGTALLLIGSYVTLRFGRFWLPPTTPVAALLLTVIARTGQGYLQERSQRNHITNAFGHYLAPALVERLAADPDQLQLGGETRELTILFCDIRGFTTISESLKGDPQRLTSLINRVLDTLTDKIMGQDGYVDKYIGDCVMAFWNAPADEPAHALKAVMAAQQMMSAMDALGAELQREAEAEGRPYLPIRIGIGINTGTCVVGNMGAKKRLNYSALGDAVNLASRLESATKEHHVDLILGETTALAVANKIPLQEIGVIHVKGKNEAVRVFTFADVTQVDAPAVAAS